MPSPPHVGRALRRLRRHRKVTQEQLGSMAGVSRSMLSDYECGRNQPPIDAVARILLALSYNFRDLQECLAELGDWPGPPARVLTWPGARTPGVEDPLREKG